jgi:hypothetical protein
MWHSWHVTGAVGRHDEAAPAARGKFHALGRSAGQVRRGADQFGEVVREDGFGFLEGGAALGEAGKQGVIVGKSQPALKASLGARLGPRYAAAVPVR